MSISSCCLKGFKWEGTPVGRVDRLADNDTYITGNNPDVAVMLIHNLLGWTYPNARLLADHFAEEVDATVYVPDFFGGEIVPWEPVLADRMHEIDMAGFVKRNGPGKRDEEIFAFGRALRAEYKFVGVSGYCFGGWAAIRLGAKEHQPPLVDCIIVGHPSLLKKEDIDTIAVPAQFLAPEHDPVYGAELKTHTFETLQKLGVPFDYQHFPGVSHGCLLRGDDTKEGEREAMVRGKIAAVDWLKHWLHE